MSTASWEEASRCPICGMPGEDVVQTPSQRRSVVHTLKCHNERCRWYGTTWLVQVNADGSIPIRKPGAKEYSDLTPGQEAMARAFIEDIREQGD